MSIAGIVSASLSAAFIEVLKAQCEYSNAKAHREQAEREVILAAERQEYVLSAIKKAKMNYDLCVQKVAEVQKAIDVAQFTQENAIKRFEAAEIALSTAVTVYQSSIVSENTDEVVVEAASDVPEDAGDETATVEQDEINQPTPVCEESVADQPTHVETDDIKSVEEECSDSCVSVKEVDLDGND